MDIIINNKELDERLIEVVKKALRQMITQLEELNLSSLQYIFVPDDFHEELIKFQRRHQLQEGYTDNEFGTAMGKVLSYLDNGVFKTSIFFNSRIIFTLFDQNLKQLPIHLMHHEFCHVHDDYEKYQVFGVTNLEDLFINTPDRVSQVTYAHADLIWSEYIATKLSVKSKPNDHDLYVESLLSVIPKTIEKYEEELQEYRILGDIDKLFSEIQLNSSLLLKIAAYFIGYCHGFGIDPPKEINNFVKQYLYLNGVWEQLPSNLHKLHESYGNWDNIRVFDDLANIVKMLWSNIGIFPKNKNGQLFIHVP